MSHRNNDSRIYVGNLPPDVRDKDIDDLFYKFGKISYIDLKNRRGPPFAFIEFDDPRDAEDAVHARDGYDYDGYRLRVEFPRGRERGPGGAFLGGRGRDGGRDRRDRDYGRGGRGGNDRGPASRRSQYRVIVSSLPPSGSWQDLKDHMREAGDVCYADVYKDGTGVVEYLRAEDMKYAVRKLNGSKFRSHEGEVSELKVREDSGRSRSRSRSRGRSNGKRGSAGRSPRRSRSRSRSRSKESRSRSRSRDRDDSRSKSRSRDRSRSRSRSSERRSRSRSRSRSKSK